ncbi:hypothetical protein D3C81_556620 [compost metagenome]
MSETMIGINRTIASMRTPISRRKPNCLTRVMPWAKYVSDERFTSMNRNRTTASAAPKAMTAARITPVRLS